MNQDPSQLPQPNYTEPQQPGQQPQPVQQPENPMDYLNSISAPTKTKMINPLFLWLGIGGVLLIVLVLASTLLFGGRETGVERYNNLSFRIQSLQALTKSSSKAIKSSKLLAINGSLSTILNSAVPELQKLSASTDTKVAKPVKDSPLLVEFSTLSAKLEDARLNVRFDTTYAREVSYQISKLRSEIKIVTNETRSAGLKLYLETLDTDLKNLNEQFSTFNG